MLTEHDFATGAVTIHYAAGPATGPPLVLLHGLTANRQAWDDLIPAFTPAWQVLACDLRGHGQSGRVAGRYRLVDYAGDVAALLGGVAGAPAVLLGHSLGASVALATATLAPARVRALVLLDPPLFARHLSIREAPASHDWFQLVYGAVQGDPAPAEVEARLRAALPEADAATVAGLAAQIAPVAAGTVATALHDQLYAGLDLDGVLAGIACPTLLLYGEWALGGVVRAEDAAWFQTHLPGAERIQMAGSGHLFPWEQMPATLAHVQRFLATL